FAEAGKAQVLVGDPACAIIDHENEPAREQQQADHTEKSADHTSPCYLVAPCPARLTGPAGEIQLCQHLTARIGAGMRPPKALTLRNGPSIRPSMAAGAILPPLFFERCAS